MATKPLTSEEIANTERKLDMPLDEIIKLSKNATMNPKKNQRAPNKSQKTFINPAQEKALKRRRYMESRPFVRQGFLAQRRTNFQANQFSLTTEIARKAAVAPLNTRPFSQNGVANSSKPRAGNFTAQRRAAGGFVAKSPSMQLAQHKQQQQGDMDTKQRPKTLDSLFAHMKEQRTRTMLQQNNAFPRRGNGFQPKAPWLRGRYVK